jgi:hypothetical protein
MKLSIFSNRGMKMSDISEILFNSLVILGLILLGSVFFYQTRRKNRKAFYLTIGVFLGVIGQSLYVFIMIIDSSATSVLQGKYLRDLIFGGFYFFVFLHYQGLTRDRVIVRLTSIIVGILAIQGMLTLLFWIEPTNPLIQTIIARFVNFIGLTCFSYAFYVSTLTSMKVRERESLFESIFIFIVFFAHIIYVLGDNGFLSFLSTLGGYEFIADIGGTLGVYGLFLTYLANIDYLYRLPVPIHQILIFSDSGLPIYTRDVYSQGIEQTKVEETLFAGVITAISSLIKESLGTDAKLQHINATGKQVFFNEKNNMTFVIITDEGTRMLKESLLLFSRLVYAKLSGNFMEEPIQQQNYIEPIDNLLKKSFPYIAIR